MCPSSPIYMADYAARMIASGARLVGGCCGTTPQHIRAMREALDRLAPQRSVARVELARRARVETAEPSGLATSVPPTLLQRRLDAGEFLVTVELDPPRGHNVEKLVHGAKLLKDRGLEDVDARGLMRPLAEMNRGLEATGTSVGEPTSCSVGGALNPGRGERAGEMEGFLAKGEGGARGVQPQPLSGLGVLERFFAGTRPP